MQYGMELVLRGRRVLDSDLAQIQSVIAKLGHRGRFHISQELCRRWNWVNPSGALKDAACRALLLGLEARGLITLPKRRSGGIGQRRKVPKQIEFPLASAEASVGAPLDTAATQWRLTTRRGSSLYKNLLDSHHYLGYRREVGANLRYVAYAQKAPVACLGWAAAAQKVACRDRFIGWTQEQRLKRLHLVANNTRFLIIPRVPHLASHLLAKNIRGLAADWQACYGYAPVLLETFVDTTRFKGTCYKAANWIFAGLTQGRGKYDRHTRRPETVKAIWLYPLRPDFRQVLCHG